MKKEVRRLFYREDSHSPVFSGRLALIDVETSGLSFAKGAEIVEIAILVMEQDGTVIDEYQSLIGARGGAGDTSIHQISDEMIWGAPRFADIAGDVLDFIGDAAIVAHNASFEDRFLLPEFERAGVYGMQLPALCSLRAARAAMPYLSSHKLGDLMSTYGHRMRDAHTALGDVRALAQILPAILEDLPPLRFGESIRPPVQSLGTPTCTREDARTGSARAAVRVPRSRAVRGSLSIAQDEPAHEERTDLRIPRSRVPRDLETPRETRSREPRSRATRAEADSPQWNQRLSFLPRTD